MNILMLILALVLLPQLISPDSKMGYVVWNVGQGQWITRLGPKTCHHFDLGGEYNITHQAAKLCANKKNYIYFTHSDRDHINWARSFSHYTSACVVQLPEDAGFKKKKRYFVGIPMCTKVDNSFLKIIKPSSYLLKKSSAPNDANHIYILDDVFLISGDSPLQKENLWLKKITNPYSIKYFMAGHHGSRTSTGDYLLRHLPNLKQIYVSARKKKYGHPHEATLLRMQKYGRPYLSTELWGHIFIEQ